MLPRRNRGGTKSSLSPLLERACPGLDPGVPSGEGVGVEARTTRATPHAAWAEPISFMKPGSSSSLRWVKRQPLGVFTTLLPL